MITSDVNPYETFQIRKQLQMFECWTIQGSEDGMHIKFILTICSLLLQILDKISIPAK